VLVAPLLPFLLKTDDNPEGIDSSVFDGIAARIAADRPAAMKDLLDLSTMPAADTAGGEGAVPLVLLQHQVRAAGR